MSARKPRVPAPPKHPAAALAAKLGLRPAPKNLRFTLAFRAPRQGDYQPPDYLLRVDAAAERWCTYQHYNAVPRAITPARVQVPVELTRVVVKDVRPASARAQVTAWARALLAR